MPDPHQGERTGGSPGARAAIATGAVQLFRRYTGRGPTQAKVTIQDDLALVVLRNTLSASERELAQAGAADDVLRLRQACQMAMREELVALVEEQLGRKVEVFSSHNSLDPDLAIELFVLDGSS